MKKVLPAEEDTQEGLEKDYHYIMDHSSGAVHELSREIEHRILPWIIWRLLIKISPSLGGTWNPLLHVVSRYEKRNSKLKGGSKCK